MASSISPNQTLYVHNLNEKLTKEVFPHNLKRAFYSLFSQFGAVLDIVALKTTKMRGQAFVVFRDIASATHALRSLQGFPFFDRELRISYAKDKSHFIAKADGTISKKDALKKPAAAKPKSASTSAPTASSASAHTAQSYETSNEIPNRILFVANLPAETTDVMVHMLFNQYAGLKEVRLIPNRQDIAFVEFDSDTNATLAKDGLNGFKINDSLALSVSYSKK